MEYFEMLEDLRSMGYSLEIKTLDTLWLLTLTDTNFNKSLDMDESLESLIGKAYHDYYLNKK